MKTIYAAFERVANVKAAIGRSKKETWNQADYWVIFPEKPSLEVGDEYFEFGDEHFIDSPDLPRTSQWPALQEHELEGIGKVKMAISLKFDPSPDRRNVATLINRELIADGLRNNKITAIIDAGDEAVPKIKTIFESEGGEITIFDEKREEIQG